MKNDNKKLIYNSKFCWKTLKFNDHIPKYFEKATKFCKISTVDSIITTQDKYKVEISQNFEAFSKYMNFNEIEWSSGNWMI